MAIKHIEKNDEKCNKTDPFKISGFCETIGSTSEDNILKYIERQKNCQL